MVCMGLVRCPRSVERCNTVTCLRDLTRDTCYREIKKRKKSKNYLHYFCDELSSRSYARIKRTVLKKLNTEVA